MQRVVVMLHHFCKIDRAKVPHKLAREEEEWILQEVQRVCLILPGQELDGLGDRIKTFVEEWHFKHAR